MDEENLKNPFVKPSYTVVGVVGSVLGTLINTSSAGTGSNPIFNCCCEFLSNIECSINVHRIREDLLRKILWDWLLFFKKKKKKERKPTVSNVRSTKSDLINLMAESGKKKNGFEVQNQRCRRP
jgi:hypothetical protein